MPALKQLPASYRLSFVASRLAGGGALFKPIREEPVKLLRPESGSSVRVPDIASPDGS